MMIDKRKPGPNPNYPCESCNPRSNYVVEVCYWYDKNPSCPKTCSYAVKRMEQEQRKQGKLEGITESSKDL